jgi:hypothetical protein
LWLTLLLLLPLQAWLLLEELAQADASGRFSRKALPRQVERLGEVLGHPLVKAWLDVNMASLTPSKVRQHGTALGGHVWVATRIVCYILRINCCVLLTVVVYACCQLLAVVERLQLLQTASRCSWPAETCCNGVWCDWLLLLAAA